MTSNNPQSADDRLQQEFNRWAEEGEGEKMERHHLDITQKTLRHPCVLAIQKSSGDSTAEPMYCPVA